MKTKKVAITVAAVFLLLGLAAGMAGIYWMTRPEPQQGSKTVTVTVVHKDQKEKTFTYHTDEEFLDKVLLAEGLVEGPREQYGLVIEKVDGEAALWTDNVFWALYIGDEQATVGVSQVPVYDGAVYRLVYESFT